MEDPVEQQGKVPDASPMISAAVVEPPDPDGSLSVDQVSEEPPEAVLSPIPPDPASVVPEGLEPDDGGDATSGSPCSEGERAPLVLTGRVPETIEPEVQAPSPARPRRGSRVLLDPSQALDVPPRPPPPRKGKALPPRFTALIGGLFGLAAIASVLALVIQLDGPSRTFGPPSASSPASSSKPPSLSALARAPAASTATSNAGSTASAPAADKPSPVEPKDDDKAEAPGPFRVAQLASDEGVKLISGKLGTKSLMDALEDEHVPKPQIFRVLKSFDDAKVFDKPKKSHSFVVAIERGSKRVKGFEYQASPTDIWQAKEDGEGKLVGTKLDMKVEQKRVAKAVLVGADLKTAVVEAGFDDDIVDALDQALGDRISLSRFSKGSTLRVVAQEQTVNGKFARYLSVEAVEYATPRAEKPTRIYHYKAGKSSGYYDDRGKAPYQGGWRAPLKLARVTSRFNPKRLHPVLHTVMPHNGVDFGAPTGTPVYAVSHGTVTHVGPHGPSGNLVLLDHEGGIQTGYAHLSRFAPGIKAGDKVETRQLIGFVGTTGRSTGPHLHFSVKKNGQFVDPQTALKMDGERVLPKGEREAFDALRAELDKVLDSIALPDRPAPAPGGDDDKDDDDHNHGDEDEGSAAAPAASAAPGGSPGKQAPDEGEKPAPPPAAAPAPAAPASKDDSSVDSAVWKPY